MVQVFDPTDGNMTPCTESLRYFNYVIKNCGLYKWGKVSCIYFIVFSYYEFLINHVMCYLSGSAAYNGCDDEASPLSQVSHPQMILIKQAIHCYYNSKLKKTNS